MYEDVEEIYRSRQSFIESFKTISKFSLLLYFIADRLIIKLSFYIYFLTQLEYLILTL